MKRMLVVIISLLAFVGTADAQNAMNEQARQQVLGTVEALCGRISTIGFDKELVLEGDINTELEGLAKRLVDLGLEGAAQFNTREYSGVLHDELGVELKNIRDCNLKVWDDLKSILLSLEPRLESREVAQFNRACSESGRLTCQGRSCEYIEYRFFLTSSGERSEDLKYSHQKVIFHLDDIKRSQYDEIEREWGDSSWTDREVYMRCSVGDCISTQDLDSGEREFNASLNLDVTNRSCGKLLASIVAGEN